MTVMKDEDPARHPAVLRAATLLVQGLEAMWRVIEVSDAPIKASLTPKLRRAFRREAARLRAGKTQPRYRNLHTPEELADILERTALRDETLEQSLADLQRILTELQHLFDQYPADATAITEFLAGTRRTAEAEGPGSPAALWHQELVEYYSRRRRRRTRARLVIPAPAPDRVEERKRRSAAEILTAAPSPEETVIPIPPEDRAAGRERLLIRIGIDEESWVGSFVRGPRDVSNVGLLPDDQHLFVSAGGAGYIIDAGSRTLVQDLGTDFAGVLMDKEPMTLFVVHHGDGSLEAFGPTGRLWRTIPISAGGAFRGLTITADALVGETRQVPGEGWVEFSVDLATGEVF